MLTKTGPKGVFGATRGVERLLEVFRRKNIKASW